MFGTDKYDTKVHFGALASPQLAYEPIDNIGGKSFLVWTERYVECLTVGCFSSCDLSNHAPLGAIGEWLSVLADPTIGGSRHVGKQLIGEFLWNPT
jgi:hypothetical protein